MKISIVTPSYNAEAFIRKTIDSVIFQAGDFEIEYFIVDGNSTDSTVSIIQEYVAKILEKKLTLHCKNVSINFISEKDNGMYDAINKGFAKASGDIFAYINADDIYLPGTFEIISKTFSKFPQIKWLKGTTSFMNEKDEVYQKGLCLIYNQSWIEKGIYGRNAYFIHQDSVFWRKELWQKIGVIEVKYRLAGDYYLWIAFSKFTELWSIKYPVSCFRKRAGQLSNDMQKYRNEQKEISKPQGFVVAEAKFFFWFKSKFKSRHAHKFFLNLYPLIFLFRKKEYIDLTSSHEPIIKKARSYIV